MHKCLWEEPTFKLYLCHTPYPVHSLMFMGKILYRGPDRLPLHSLQALIMSKPFHLCGTLGLQTASTSSAPPLQSTKVKEASVFSGCTLSSKSTPAALPKVKQVHIPNKPCVSWNFLSSCRAVHTSHQVSLTWQPWLASGRSREKPEAKGTSLVCPGQGLSVTASVFCTPAGSCFQRQLTSADQKKSTWAWKKRRLEVSPFLFIDFNICNP